MKNTFIIAIQSLQVNSILMFIISNHDGINVLVFYCSYNCNGVFKVIFEVMAHCYHLVKTIIIAIQFLQCKENELYIVVIIIE